MEILERTEHNVGVLTLKGNIVAQTVGDIKNFLESYIERIDLVGIVLDCQGVEFVDSAGLGLLASIFKTLKKMDRKLAICSVNSRIMETFTLTNLNNIFLITADIESAVEAIK